MAKPSGGDTRPAAGGAGGDASGGKEPGSGRRRRRRRGGRGGGGQGEQGKQGKQGSGRQSQGRGKQGRQRNEPVEAITDDGPLELDEATLKTRRGRERRGKPLGRYLMCVSVGEGGTQIAVLEGRNLIEHYLSRPADDVSEIHGNVYLSKVQNVLPGMEAAFVDIGTP
ncbi:MAG TPA: ribonuclease E/G, partial [Acidimicrobiales bacterium]|nr:ribonuclease E/G [Acidimicrobiales bacterium]